MRRDRYNKKEENCATVIYQNGWLYFKQLIFKKSHRTVKLDTVKPNLPYDLDYNPKKLLLFSVRLKKICNPNNIHNSIYINRHATRTVLWTSVWPYIVETLVRKHAKIWLSFAIWGLWFPKKNMCNNIKVRPHIYIKWGISKKKSKK